jgi:REP element-mobilizing transposase RayT
MKFKPLSPIEPIRRYRRNLPHWRVTGATYFVTFRTADSLPSSRLRQLEEQRLLWVQLHPPPWSEAERDEYCRYRFQKLDHWLDSGFGSCPLKEFKISTVVEKTLRFYDGQQYSLDLFAIMPNHVHALVLPYDSWELEEILQNWKSYSAHSINKLLRRSGRFWLDENYDRIVRTVVDLNRIRSYISDNPIRGSLSAGEYIVGCGEGFEA